MYKKSKFFFLSVWFIIMLYILVGCNGNSLEDNVKEGSIAITIKIPSTTDTLSLMNIPVESTNIGLRIFNENRNIIEDIDLPESGTVSKQINLPVGIYNIHAFSYKDSSNSVKEIFTIGEIEGIVVEADKYTNASIILERPNISLSTYVIDESGNEKNANSIEGGKEFYISCEANFCNFEMSSWYYYYIYLDGEELTRESLSDLVTSEDFKYTAPTVENDSTLSIVFEKYVTENNVYGNEQIFYTFYFPSSTLGDVPIELSVVPAGGGISIGIE